MIIQLAIILFIFLAAFIFYISGLESLDKKRKLLMEGKSMENKINKGVMSMQSMTKTTIKVEQETRRKIKILAARLNLDMDAAIRMAAKCLDKSLDSWEEVK